MLVSGIRTAFASRGYRIFGALNFAVSLLLYLMTLPASFTGGRIGFAAMRYLDAGRVGFAILMAALLALLVPMLVFQLRRGQRTRKASAAGGIAVGVMAPVLCCSPLLPIALGFVATVFPSLVAVLGWQLQGFIATHQIELFSAASLLLAIAVYQNARGIARGPSCALPAAGAPPSNTTPEAAAVSGENPPG